MPVKHAEGEKPMLNGKYYFYCKLTGGTKLMSAYSAQK